MKGKTKMASTQSKESQQRNDDQQAVVTFKQCVRQAEELVGNAPAPVFRRIVAELTRAALEKRQREPDFEEARAIVADIVRAEAKAGGA
jgi:hypothetical protein